MIILIILIIVFLILLANCKNKDDYNTLFDEYY